LHFFLLFSCFLHCLLCLIVLLKQQLGEISFMRRTNMQKKWLSFSFVIVSCFVLSIQVPSSALAKDTEGTYESKDEVVYGNLNHQGDTRNMYIVNAFDIKEKCKSDGYDEDDSAKNLYELSEVKNLDEKMTFDEQEAKFYYQRGIEKKPFACDMEIEYKLDGKKIEPNKLAGQGGHLAIE